MVIMHHLSMPIGATVWKVPSKVASKISVVLGLPRPDFHPSHSADCNVGFEAQAPSVPNVVNSNACSYRMSPKKRCRCLKARNASPRCKLHQRDTTHIFAPQTYTLLYRHRLLVIYRGCAGWQLLVLVVVRLDTTPPPMRILTTIAALLSLWHEPDIDCDIQASSESIL